VETQPAYTTQGSIRVAAAVASPGFAGLQTQLRVLQDGRLVVIVADNGGGFQFRPQQAGNDGLANMNGRLQSLGGGCVITSAPGQGTTVRFSAPLPQIPL